ncbi:hypothetical protein SDC9_209297 [bioreactor metagenome]|uniref:Uncharacterized protein n=1 Tax=bioreactor metagenome TaxID=1076179 RepID=A0A645JFW6_9ZZZZ
MTASTQKFLIDVQKATMCQSSGGVPCFRPRVTEIQVQFFYFSRFKPFFQIGSIAGDNFDISPACFLCLFCRIVTDVSLCFHTYISFVRIKFCQPINKGTLAAANLQRQWLTSKHFLPMSLMCFNIIENDIFIF